MTPAEQDAVEEAVQAVREVESHLENGGGPFAAASALEVLERELGPLDWSVGGDGFALLREVHDRAFGVSEPPDPKGTPGPKLSDVYHKGVRDWSWSSSRG